METYTIWVKAHDGRTFSVVTNGGIMLARITWDALKAQGVEMACKRP